MHDLIKRVKELTGWDIKPSRFRIVTDTTDWMSIYRGNILRISGRDYVVKGNMHEPRFGIDDIPKYWVFNAIDLDSGDEKIIKTVFHEEFTAHIGVFRIKCYRSPEKESEVLDFCRGDQRFMQGFTAFDEKGNNIRIIDFIRGKKIFHYIPGIPKPHEQYFYEDLPGILFNLYGSFLGLKKLHDHSLCHGDVRNDHLIIDSENGLYKWIDFDLKQEVDDFDLWSLGNILSYSVGKGIRTFTNVLNDESIPQALRESFTTEDSSAFYQYRIMNLQKLFPYIPGKLSAILRNFTINPPRFYRNMDEFIQEYSDMLVSEFNFNPGVIQD